MIVFIWNPLSQATVWQCKGELHNNANIGRSLLLQRFCTILVKPFSTTHPTLFFRQTFPNVMSHEHLFQAFCPFLWTKNDTKICFRHKVLLETWVIGVLMACLQWFSVLSYSPLSSSRKYYTWLIFLYLVMYRNKWKIWSLLCFFIFRPIYFQAVIIGWNTLIKNVYFLSKVCLTQKYILGLPFFKKSFEPAALVYSYLWDKLATKGEIRKWLGCVSYLYTQGNDNSVIMYHIYLYTEENRYSVMVYHIYIYMKIDCVC